MSHKTKTLTFAGALAGIVLLFGTAASAAEHTVLVITDYKNLQMQFSPRDLTIQPGDTVTWVNQAAEEHNVVTYPDGFPEGAQGFASEIMTKTGETWSHTFTVEGTYEYHCIPHLFLGMHGSVIVGKRTPEGGFHKPTAQEVKQYSKRLLTYFDEDEARFIPRNRRTEDQEGNSGQHGHGVERQ